MKQIILLLSESGSNYCNFLSVKSLVYLAAMMYRLQYTDVLLMLPFMAKNQLQIIKLIVSCCYPTMGRTCT